MWLVVGLGNPGEKYQFTRHNIGFMSVLDFLGFHTDKPRFKNEHKSHVARVHLENIDKDILVCLPQTFMNLSGDAVQSIMHYYKIELPNLLVVHDDIDMPFGRIKFQKNRGPGGHNGIKSISQMLGTQDYARLKLGVGRKGGVLDAFSKDEERHLGDYLEKATEGIESFIRNGFDKTAGVFNQKDDDQKEDQIETDSD